MVIVNVSMCFWFMYSHICLYSHDSDNFVSGISSMRFNEGSILSQMLAKKSLEVPILVLRLIFIEIHRGPLLYRLEFIGVKGRLLEWINSYLSNRKESVTISGTVSAWHLFVSECRKD